MPRHHHSSIRHGVAARHTRNARAAPRTHRPRGDSDLVRARHPSRARRSYRNTAPSGARVTRPIDHRRVRRDRHAAAAGSIHGPNPTHRATRRNDHRRQASASGFPGNPPGGIGTPRPARPSRDAAVRVVGRLALALVSAAFLIAPAIIGTSHVELHRGSVLWLARSGCELVIVLTAGRGLAAWRARR